MKADDGMKSPAADALRERLALDAEAAEARGDRDGAASLRTLAEAWWQEHEMCAAGFAGVLGAHHEINNALVGIRGNAQLLLMNPAVQQKGIRERLEVVLRESSRIQEAAARLRGLKAWFDRDASRTRAA